MLKRMLSLCLCAAMVLSLLPSQVFATEDITEPMGSVAEPVEETTAPVEEETTGPAEPTEEETEPAEEVTEPTEEETEPAEEPELIFLEAQELDHEELLMGYLSRLYTGGEGAFFGTMARDRLSPANQHLYDGLKELVVQMAKGEKNNTSIDVSFEDSGYSPVDADMTLVQEALLFDFPFEMYWYYGCYSGRGSNFYRVIMVPNPYYQAAGFDHTSSPYIDTDKTKKASAAAENIYAIKTRYEASSDYDKLSAYVDEICALVEYDTEAAKNSDSLYSNDNRPWTLINVFDDDPTTNVVCEGYSEAFQYLCDESTFQGDVVCISVTGVIPAGGHKWNIVRIEGASYLMDVTNYDYNGITDRSFLFLSGGTGSVAAGYTVDGILFTYDNESLSIYGSGEDSVLKLSPTKYTPPATYTILYDANGGANAPNSQKKTQGKDLTLRQEIPEREDYTFLGWAITSTATVAEYQPGGTYSGDGDAVLYAVWKLTACPHSFGEYQVTEPATCDKAGTEERVCTLCGATESREIPVGHTVENGVCTRCGVYGSCGDNLIWSFDSEMGILTISGEGAMSNFEANAAPWSVLKTQIRSLVMEQNVTSIGTNAFGGCTELNGLTFTGDAPAAIAEDAFTQVTATAYYPTNNSTWTSDVMQNYGGTITWVPYGGVENQVLIPAADLGSQTSVWIDGKEYAVQTDSGMPYVDLPDGNAKTMVVHSYGVSNGKQYPLGMKVWMLSNADGLYTATRVKELDNILGYEGSSIRVTGTQGIRMITSVDQNDKAALTGEGLAGYTLKEYGTATAWASRLADTRPLILGKSHVSSNYAYSREHGKDPVFDRKNGRIQYTNVLVDFTLDQCEKDLAMRPYMILEDAEGNAITLYGGIVERSIGYIAYQNRDAFAAGTDAYEYIWEIIHHVYGDAYDAEYKG